MKEIGILAELPATMEMEDMTTSQKYGGDRRKRLSETDHAHIISILLQFSSLITAM